VWTAVAAGAVVTVVGVGLAVGLTVGHGAPAAPMLGSAGTFDTRGP
jgi:hypothetical protein